MIRVPSVSSVAALALALFANGARAEEAAPLCFNYGCTASGLFLDPGEPATIYPLAEWRKGARPAQSGFRRAGR